jgi:hypothetical protein
VIRVLRLSNLNRSKVRDGNQGTPIWGGDRQRLGGGTVRSQKPRLSMVNLRLNVHALSTTNLRPQTRASDELMELDRARSAEIVHGIPKN